MASPGKSDREKILLALLFAGIFLVYSPSWRGGFLSWGESKGVVEVARNPVVHGFSMENLRALFQPRHPSHLAPDGAYLPLRDFSYMVDYTFWGLNPMGYHLENTLLFLAGLVALFLLLKRLLPRGRGAFAAIALFAFHPVYAESVAWISSRPFLLSFLFFTLAFLLFLRFQETGRALFYWASLGAFLGALLSHPFSAVFPIALVIYLLFPREKGKKRTWSVPALLLRWLPFFAAAVLWTALILWVQAPAKDTIPKLFTTTLAAPFAASGMIVNILRRFVCPLRLCAVYETGAGDPFSFFRMASLVGVAALLFLGFLLLLARRRSGFFLLLFFVSLVPFLGLIPLYHYSADRYLLLAGIGFFPFVVLLFLKVSDILGRVWRPEAGQWGSRILWGIAVVVLGFLSFQRQKIWKNNMTFWKDVVEKAPFYGPAQYQMGGMLWMGQKEEEALTCFETAIDLDPRFFQAYYQASELLISMGEPLRAKALMEEAASLDPGGRDTELYLASAYIGAERYQEAETILQRIHRESPDDPLIILFLGKLYLKWGDKKRGIELLQQALDLGFRGIRKKEILGILAHTYEELQMYEMAVMYYGVLLGMEGNEQNRQLLRLQIAKLKRRMKKKEE